MFRLAKPSVYLLDARLQRQRIPDLLVRVHRLGELLGPGCVLGFDFLRQFQEARLRFLSSEALELTLIDP